MTGPDRNKWSFLGRDAKMHISISLGSAQSNDIKVIDSWRNFLPGKISCTRMRFNCWSTWSFIYGKRLLRWNSVFRAPQSFRASFKAIIPTKPGEGGGNQHTNVTQAILNYWHLKLNCSRLIYNFDERCFYSHKTVTL